MPDNKFVTVNEVGPRDGLQNQPELLSTEGKLRLIRALVDAGIKSIEASAFVSPKAVPQMADAQDLFAALPTDDGVAYTALVPNEKGYERALVAGVKSVAVVLSATETMNQKNICMSLAQTRSVCSSVVKRAAEEGLESRAYIAVAFECPYEGPMSQDRVVELTQEMFDSGASEVVIADTIGAANPSAVFAMFERLKQSFPLQKLSAHFHDTRAMALANAWAALQVGLRKFDSSIGGLGGCPFAPGASGNVATEDLVLMLHQCGYRTGVDVDGMRRAITLAEELVKRPVGGRMLPWLKAQEEHAARAKAS